MNRWFERWKRRWSEPDTRQKILDVAAPAIIIVIEIVGQLVR